MGSTESSPISPSLPNFCKKDRLARLSTCVCNARQPTTGNAGNPRVVAGQAPTNPKTGSPPSSSNSKRPASCPSAPGNRETERPRIVLPFLPRKRLRGKARGRLGGCHPEGDQRRNWKLLAPRVVTCGPTAQLPDLGSLFRGLNWQGRQFGRGRLYCGAAMAAKVSGSSGSGHLDPRPPRRGIGPLRRPARAVGRTPPPRAPLWSRFRAYRQLSEPRDDAGHITRATPGIRRRPATLARARSSAQGRRRPPSGHKRFPKRPPASRKTSPGC